MEHSEQVLRGSDGVILEAVVYIMAKIKDKPHTLIFPFFSRFLILV